MVTHLYHVAFAIIQVALFPEVAALDLYMLEQRYLLYAQVVMFSALICCVIRLVSKDLMVINLVGAHLVLPQPPISAIKCFVRIVPHVLHLI